MRTFVATILAILLIFVGVLIVGLASVRIFQESGSLRMDINTAGAGATVAAAALRTDLLDGKPQSLSGVENGGMALSKPAPQLASAPTVSVSVSTSVTIFGSGDPGPAVPITVPVPVDPCPPQAEGGWPADAPVAAIGMVRLYTLPDLASQPLGEFGAGQNFLVTIDPAGVTAVRRCDLVWVRVRLAGGVMGWVLSGAITVAPPAPTPTLPPICPGGCGTPTPCWNPCNNPCQQPCNDPCNQPCTQPCTSPCGVYSQ